MTESAAPSPLLELRGMRKEFPGVVALDDVEFDLLPGEVHALVGENGAGKSTLIKLIAGVYKPDAGEMLVEGEPVVFHKPADAIARRIKVVYQELDLVPDLSVAENVFLGGYPKTSRGLVDWTAMRQRTAALLAELGLAINPETPVGELRVAEQQLVEIARALSRQAQVVIMDEPTSALSKEEVDRLFGVVEQLRQRGVGIIYVSHKLDEIFRIADRVTVFRDGRKVVTADIARTNAHELVTWMVGRELRDLFPKTPAEPGAVLLEARGVTGSGIYGVDLEVRAGEVVGVFGLMGAGINTLARVLFGASHREAGSVALDGREIKPNSPADAMTKGLGLLTENRKEDGLVLPMPVKDNITLASLRRFATFTWMHPRQ